MSWKDLVDWTDKHELVTGATGLLGQHLVRCERLRGAKIFGIVRDRAPGFNRLMQPFVQIHGDIRDADLVRRAVSESECEVIFHLAAQPIVGVGIGDPVTTFETNVMGTVNVLEAARQIPTVRAVLVASSDKAYGRSDKAYVETDPLRGGSPYDTSKSCTDLVAQSYAGTYARRIAILRCGNIFGRGDENWSRIVPGTIRSLARGTAPVVRSDGKFVRDYIYAGDAADAYVYVATEMLLGNVGNGEAYNVSYELPRTVLEIVEQIRLLMGSELRPIVLDAARGEIRSQVLSSDKIGDLGWEAHVGFESGLRQTVADYLEEYDGKWKRESVR